MSTGDPFGGMTFGRMLDERVKLKIAIGMMESDMSSSAASLGAFRDNLGRLEQLIATQRTANTN